MTKNELQQLLNLTKLWNRDAVDKVKLSETSNPDLGRFTLEYIYQAQVLMSCAADLQACLLQWILDGSVSDD